MSEQSTEQVTREDVTPSGVAALRMAADNMPINRPGQLWEGAADWLRRRADAIEAALIRAGSDRGEAAMTSDRATPTADPKRRPENPDPDLFVTFERLELCHRVKVTEDNIHRLARFFGCSVDYSGDVPTLRNPSNHPVKVGSWLDHKGSAWNPEPRTQGWSPAGTFEPRNRPGAQQ